MRNTLKLREKYCDLDTYACFFWNGYIFFALTEVCQELLKGHKFSEENGEAIFRDQNGYYYRFIEKDSEN